MKILPALILAVFYVLPASAASEESVFSGGYKDHNIILISMTNLGANRMSLYGYGRKTTPKLDAWAKDGLVFEEVFSHASWTLPAATSLLTSMVPYTHRVWRRDLSNALSREVKTLPDVMAGSGYITAAFTGGLDYNPAFSQLRGFQFSKDNPNFTSFETTLAQAKEWLAGHSDRKFMLLIQGYDLHCPFQPQGKFKGTFSDAAKKSANLDPNLCVRGYKNESGGYHAFYSGGCPLFLQTKDCSRQGEAVTLTQGDIDYLSSLYDDKVLEVDTLISGFLRSLDKKLLKKTIVVVTSDHGEMFAKHGRFGRAGTRRGTHYDDVLHVPLIVRLPGRHGARVAGLVQVIDIMPTLLDALALPAPETVQGKTMAPLIGAGTPINQYVFSGMPYNLMLGSRVSELDKKLFEYMNVTESIRSREWKLIYERLIGVEPARSKDEPAESYELYDIRHDPEELHDLSKTDPEILKTMQTELKNWTDRAMRASSHSSVTEKVPEEILRKAKERGYWQQ